VYYLTSTSGPLLQPVEDFSSFEVPDFRRFWGNLSFTHSLRSTGSHWLSQGPPSSLQSFTVVDADSHPFHDSPPTALISLQARSWPPLGLFRPLGFFLAKTIKVAFRAFGRSIFPLYLLSLFVVRKCFSHPPSPLILSYAFFPLPLGPPAPTVAVALASSPFCCRCRFFLSDDYPPASPVCFDCNTS